MRVSWARVALVAFLLTAVAATSGCGREQLPVSTASPTDPVGLTVIAPPNREPAPSIAGNTLSGGTADVAAMRGDPVVVNAWASWCAPCREEIPVLKKAATANPRVKFLGLNVQDRPEAAAAFASQVAIPWPSIEDPQGQILSQIPGVPPKALPSTIAIDRQGRIAARVVGPVKPEMVQPLLDSVAE